MKTKEEYIKYLKSIDYSNTAYTDKEIKTMQKSASQYIESICQLDGQTLCDIDYEKEFILKFDSINIGHNGLIALTNKDQSVLARYVLGMLHKVSGNGWGTGVNMIYE